jgi:hypothetical protein
MLLYDLSHYVTSPGFAGLLIGLPGVYVVAVAVLAAVTLWLGRSRWSWLAAAVTVAMALPRFFVYDVTYLQVAMPLRSAGEAQEAESRAPISATRRAEGNVP